jgi:hypothetical protein
MRGGGSEKLSRAVPLGLVRESKRATSAEDSQASHVATELFGYEEEWRNEDGLIFIGTPERLIRGDAAQHLPPLPRIPPGTRARKHPNDRDTPASRRNNEGPSLRRDFMTTIYCPLPVTSGGVCM